MPPCESSQATVLTMDKTASSLKVRVVLPEPPAVAAPPVHRGYHWKRIFIVLILVAGAGFFLTNGLYTLVGSSPPAEAPVSLDARPPPVGISAPVAEIPDIALTPPVSARQEPEYSEVAPPPPAPVSSESVSKPVVGQVALNTASGGPLPAIREGEIRIFSPRVERFVLASGIRDKEPVGSVRDINLDGNQLLTIYAWSKTRGLRDRFLHYRWLLDGKEVARVEIGVRSDRWRSYSSKHLSRRMQGDWLVELRSGEGELLAQATFRY